MPPDAQADGYAASGHKRAITWILGVRVLAPNDAVVGNSPSDLCEQLLRR
jgi:hypothetical protein